MCGRGGIMETGSGEQVGHKRLRMVCGFKQGVLFDQWSNSADRSMFFFQGTGGIPQHLKDQGLESVPDDLPRCTKCGCTIDEHPESERVKKQRVEKDPSPTREADGVHPTLVLRSKLPSDVDASMQPLVPRCHSEFSQAPHLFGMVTQDRKTMTIFEAMGESGFGKTTLTGKELFDYMVAHAPSNSVVKFFNVQFQEDDRQFARAEAEAYLNRRTVTTSFENYVGELLRQSGKPRLFLLFQIDEWHLNADLCHELISIAHRACTPQIAVIVAVAGFKTLLATNSQSTTDNAMTPASRAGIRPLHLPPLSRTEIILRLLRGNAQLQHPALSILADAVCGNPRCLLALVEELAFHKLAITCREEALKVLNGAVDRYIGYSGGMEYWLNNPGVIGALWSSLTGHCVDVAKAVDAGFVSAQSHCEGELLNLNTFHVHVVARLLERRDFSWRLFPSAARSSNEFEQLVANVLFLRINVAAKRGVAKMTVSDLFRGFAFSSKTGRISMKIPELRSVSKLSQKFPTVMQDIPDEASIYLKGDETPGDAVIPGIGIVKMKLNEARCPGKTISRWTIAEEGCKAGFDLSSDMAQHVNQLHKNSNSNPSRPDAAVKSQYARQRAATKRLGSKVFIFVTDKRIPSMTESISDGPFVIMDASIAEKCMPAFVRLGFVFASTSTTE